MTEPRVTVAEGIILDTPYRDPKKPKAASYLRGVAQVEGVYTPFMLELEPSQCSFDRYQQVKVHLNLGETRRLFGVPWHTPTHIEANPLGPPLAVPCKVKGKIVPTVKGQSPYLSFSFMLNGITPPARTVRAYHSQLLDQISRSQFHILRPNDEVFLFFNYDRKGNLKFPIPVGLRFNEMATKPASRTTAPSLLERIHEVCKVNFSLGTEQRFTPFPSASPFIARALNDPNTGRPSAQRFSTVLKLAKDYAEEIATLDPDPYRRESAMKLQDTMSKAEEKAADPNFRGSSLRIFVDCTNGDFETRDTVSAISRMFDNALLCPTISDVFVLCESDSPNGESDFSLDNHDYRFSTEHHNYLHTRYFFDSDVHAATLNLDGTYSFNRTTYAKTCSLLHLSRKRPPNDTLTTASEPISLPSNDDDSGSLDLMIHRPGKVIVSVCAGDMKETGSIASHLADALDGEYMDDGPSRESAYLFFHPDSTTADYNDLTTLVRNKAGTDLFTLLRWEDLTKRREHLIVAGTNGKLRDAMLLLNAVLQANGGGGVYPLQQGRVLLSPARTTSPAALAAIIEASNYSHLVTNLSRFANGKSVTTWIGKTPAPAFQRGEKHLDIGGVHIQGVPQDLEDKSLLTLLGELGAVNPEEARKEMFFDDDGRQVCYIATRVRDSTKKVKGGPLEIHGKVFSFHTMSDLSGKTGYRSKPVQSSAQPDRVCSAPSSKGFKALVPSKEFKELLEGINKDVNQVMQSASRESLSGVDPLPTQGNQWSLGTTSTKGSNSSDNDLTLSQELYNQEQSDSGEDLLMDEVNELAQPTGPSGPSGVQSQPHDSYSVVEQAPTYSAAVINGSPSKKRGFSPGNNKGKQGTIDGWVQISSSPEHKKQLIENNNGCP